MRDKFGFFRGKCGPDCLCIEYKTTPGGPVRCTECDHTPIQHESLGIVAGCKECSECERFDHSYGEYAFCDYCECSIQNHCSAPPESSLPPSYAVSTAPPAESPPKVATQIDNSYYATVVHSIPNNATQIQQQPQHGMGQVDPMGASRMDTFSEMNQHMFTTPMEQTGQTHPTNYMNPMAPTNYANPMTPTNYANPMNPTNYANPMNPTNYANPMNPTNYANPMNPTNYANPMTPTNYANPMTPTNYANPMTPTNYANPMTPTNYANPMNPTTPMNYMNPTTPMNSMMNTKKCAIQECQETSFFDPTTGGTQECCSVQHAMEHERRKAMGSNIIKGITHCLLPGCTKHVWPFMNYCSKTHAKAGMTKGLLPPDPNAGSRPQKEQSEGVCALPGCQRPRYTCPHELQQSDHIMRLRRTGFGREEGEIEQHGIYVGDFNVGGCYIPNAVATCSPGLNKNPVSILTLEEFSDSQSVTLVKHPPEITQPTQQVVKSCTDHATGQILFDGAKDGGSNLSKDFALLCKLGVRLLAQVPKLYRTIQDRDLSSVKGLMIDIFPIAWEFYEHFVKSGRCKVAFATLMNKLQLYKKLIQHGDYKKILTDIVSQIGPTFKAITNVTN